MDQEMRWESMFVDQFAKIVEGDQAISSGPDLEDSLLHAARHGDVSAFNQLVLDHQDSLFGWVFYLVGDAALAEDITQATFMTAFEKMHTFRGGSFRAWLFRIARNRGYDVMRRNKRHPSVSLDADIEDEDDFGLISVLPSETPSPEEALIQSERTIWILRLLDNLPEAFRQALVLVDMLEMDYLEAAGVLDLPLGTLKSRVARARLKLRDHISAMGAD